MDNKPESSEMFRGFCPSCQAEANLTRRVGETEVVADDQIHTVTVAYLVCLDCGETFDDPQGGDPLLELYQQIADQREQQKPAAHRRRRIRDYLGLLFFGFTALGDHLGLFFFGFAAVLALLAALEHSTLLGWLSVAHNSLLAGAYAARRPAKKVDQKGLLLGLLAAALPLAAYPDTMPIWLLIPGLAGYALTLWSLLAMGKSFGIAPADRGLVKHGPYALVRHPMYLGELVYRCILVGSHLTLANAALLVALVIVQVARIKREERIIGGYEDYMQETRWRLLPGIW